MPKEWSGKGIVQNQHPYIFPIVSSQVAIVNSSLAHVLPRRLSFEFFTRNRAREYISVDGCRPIAMKMVPISHVEGQISALPSYHSLKLRVSSYPSNNCQLSS